MEISKVKYFAHQDVLNDTIIWSRDIESLQDIDCYDIGLYGVLETSEGDILFQIDFTYDGEPFVWRKFMHMDSYLKFYRNRPLKYLDKQSEKYIKDYIEML